MSDAILKAIRWYFIAASVVLGTSCFILAERWDSVKPIGITVLAFGFVYIMTAFWKDVRGKLLAGNIAVFFLLTLLAGYAHTILYILFGLQKSDLGMLGDQFIMWGVVEAAIGIPVMTIVFWMYD